VVVVAPHRVHYRNYSQRPRRLIAHGGYAKRWSHQSSHRKGVAYRTKKTSEKYYSKRVGVHRIHNQSNKSHHNFKKNLHRYNHLSHKAKGDVKHKVKHDKVQANSATKQFASHHKPRNTSTHHYKQSRRVNEHSRKLKTHLSKRDTLSMRKQHPHRANKSNRSVSHKSASTKRHYSNSSKR
jgi:thiol:disulfide interchange protein